MGSDVRVLVVDDSDFYAELVSSVLERDYGMQTFVESNAIGALDTLESEVVDCVVTDYRMPDTNGIELLEQARERGFTQPVILLTGSGNETVAREALSAGITHYFRKNENEQDFEKLATQIENAVEQHQTEEKYELLVNNTPDFIAEIDQTGEIRMMNEAMAQSFPGDDDANELTGKHLSDLMPDDVAERRLERGKEVIETGETKRFVDGHSGEHFHNIFVPVDLPGERETFQVIARDITERRETKLELEETVEKLKRSNEQLEQFAYAASHDLQEPLRMVSSYLDLLERQYEDDLDEEAIEFIDYATDGAERMSEMINDLLQYSRVDTRGGDFEQTDLDAALDQALDNLQVAIEEADATVESDDLPTVYCDESQIVVLFQNLLSNAIKYCEETPEIYVSAEHSDQSVVVSVADNGIGIAESDLQDIFQIFSRLHHRDEYSGTGIGLAMCQKILERHGGVITVDSEPGEGSTFSFTLPTDGGNDV